MAEINKFPDFEAMAKSVLKQLPHDVANKALSHFKGSFLKEGFSDYGFIAWPRRKDDMGHKLLRRTDSLMQDLKIRSQTMQRIEISTHIHYAGMHNAGGRINLLVTRKMRRFFWAMYYKSNDEKWKAMALTKKKRLSIRIPQRQFIGESHILNTNIDKLIHETIRKQFKT